MTGVTLTSNCCPLRSIVKTTSVPPHFLTASASVPFEDTFSAFTAKM